MRWWPSGCGFRAYFARSRCRRMPDVRHPTGFLLRASILMVAMLTTWWLVLSKPLLLLLRVAVEVTLRLLPVVGTGSTISGSIAADWNFKFLVDHPASGAIRSV